MLGRAVPYRKGMEGSLRWPAVHIGRSGPFRQGVCLENEESQERASERPPCQGAHQCPWFRLSRISEWPIRKSVWPRAARQRRRSASCAGEKGWRSDDKAGPRLVGRGRIRSQDGPGPVNSVEAMLGAARNCSRHVQVFGGQRWCCGGRHRPCSGRLLQEALSSRCVGDGRDPAEVSNRTLAQEVRCGATGHVPTQILRGPANRSGCKGPERQPREGASQK